MTKTDIEITEDTEGLDGNPEWLHVKMAQTIILEKVWWQFWRPRFLPMRLVFSFYAPKHELADIRQMQLSMDDVQAELQDV
jgi:hypothetical protein